MRRMPLVAAVALVAVLTSCAVPDLRLLAASHNLAPADEPQISNAGRNDRGRRPPSGPFGVRARRGSLRVWPALPPKGRASSVTSRNPLGRRLVFLVESRRRAAGRTWLRIYLADRPNGSTAWVPRRAVDIVRLRHRIEVDLSSRTLEHYINGKLVDRFSVGVGEDQWPTPTGTYFVWARVPQPGATGPYGVFALGLSAFSPVLRDWPGGGRVAIHGTSDASDRGAAVSHGCVRVFNSEMKRLKSVPLGTPVRIHR
jgi:L,D-transpeptidase catalytic domain